MRPLIRVAQGLVLLLLVRNFFYVTTGRLYLDGQGVEASSATERYVVEGGDSPPGRVVPQILTGEDGRMRFPVHIGQPSTVRFEARPAGRASYEIALVGGGTRTVVARGAAERAVAVSHSLPPFEGSLELASHGAMTWADPRIVRDFRFAPHLAALAALAALSLVVSRRVMALELALLVASTAAAVGAGEAALRTLAPRLGEGLLAERRALGEAWPNPRWQETGRYGPRLRANVETFAEVGPGDIVRMGFVPPRVAPFQPRRFRFHTDAEGFRNESVRDPIAVAALGDSFTDAMTLPVERAWPARLEARLGVAVQNYGTAGFGPQQEERVLEDFALRHRPRVAVVAFFAGNDLFNAESFDAFERSAGRPAPAPPGWRVKETVARFDELYTVSLVRAAAGRLGAHWRDAGVARADEGGGEEDRPAPASDAASASFDRGVFTIGVAGRALRFALMPPYLNTLRFSAADLRARRGWALTERSLERMQLRCRAAGTELVVMFVPFKSQVYLPLLSRSLPPGELERALRFYFPEPGSAIPLETLARHRLAQNELLGDLCARRGIAFLDLTPALEAQVAAGRNVYIPDDAHWSEAGHDVAAAALAELLRPLVRSPPRS